MNYSDKCFVYPIIKPTIKIKTKPKKTATSNITEKDLEDSKKRYTTTYKVNEKLFSGKNIPVNFCGHFDQIKRTYKPVEY